MLPPTLTARLTDLLGAPLRTTPVSGGSINQAYRVDTPSGAVFVKHHPRPPSATFFSAEADGLARLAVAVRTPRVIALYDDALVLEYLPPTSRTPASEAIAGHALASLHSHHGDHFGLPIDNFMGALPQDNQRASRPDFTTFFRERRLAPLAHHLPTPVRHRLDALDLTRLSEPPAPTLIHGDLWSGNLHYSTTGPALIDPAVSYGHPEQDLAMTRLFGGFGADFYKAYADHSGVVFDLALDERLELLTLYPLLIHVALFGGSYLRDVNAILDRFS